MLHNIRLLLPNVTCGVVYLFSVLEINFADDDLSIAEGPTSFSTPMILQFRENQNPFNITLKTASINEAESLGLGPLIDSDTISSIHRATAGWYNSQSSL